MNLNVYVYENKFLIVDVGVTFEDMPGIEVVMPDISFLERHKDKIAGIVLTHAHEDHIGAIAHLWPFLDCPIYATAFTAKMVGFKLREKKVKASVEEVPLEGTIKVGPFKVQFVGLTHSILEPNALAITTPVGTVLHTGDWKLDPTPLVGKKTNEKRLKELGDKGVLAIVCDSTSVFEKGWSGSEKKVRDFLVSLVKEYKKGRVVIACFASNVARVLTCSEVARESGRKMGLVGRSLERIDSVARDCGYFDEIPPFLKEGEIKKVAPRDALIVSTGSQGEERAALMRMAHNKHPRVHLDEGDVVIFSSRIIPGNEKSIFALQNQLAKRGIKVVTYKDFPDVHVSGHPSEDELVQMYKWVRPHIAVPVHGEYRHLKGHADLAKSLKVPHAIIPDNGQIWCLSEKGAKKVGTVPSGRLALDGTRLIDAESALISEREQLSTAGMLQISIALTMGGKLKDLQVGELGVQEPRDHEEFCTDIEGLTKHVLGRMSADDRGDDEVVAELVEKAVRRHCMELFGKKPQVIVHVLRA